ncbi:thiamine biosynthesis enzyme [Cenarchaeum symbiosum A]|uniref:Cyclic dehypoxanthine futalosine synthase n=1 Tax=Cenarchaeum symbiosum (strain A) TaxID=414004 RepID=A0RU25_CENSY|nr:thiamine biosynthesis enzyme [Cenarchaeum symbiosum A]
MSQLIGQLHDDVEDILDNSLKGVRPDKEACLRLLRSEDVQLMGLVAGHLTKQRFGKKASFVNNIILNYTNVCITDCKFCAFYRSPGHEEAYTLTLDEIEARVKTAREMFKITQVLIQGGHNPKLKLEYYEDAFRMIRSKYPEVGVHGLSASEINMISKVEKSSTKEILSRLKVAGLQSMPGAGAEILDDEVKAKISPKKISTADWLRITEEAHREGIKSSATMMYGHVETENDVANHLQKLADLQEKTGGFMAFIPWTFEPNNTLMQSEGTVRFDSGGEKLLKMIAISRLFFDGSIDHIQSSWLTAGVGMAQLALQYGADDFGGTLIGEEVVSCTGSRATEMTDESIRRSVEQIGYEIVERDNFYNPV